MRRYHAAFHPTSRDSFRSRTCPETTWLQKFERHCAVSAKNPTANVMVGDSIIANFKQRFPKIWNTYFHNWINEGIGGDRCQHVLWRVQHGCLPVDALRIIICIGSNHIGQDPPGVVTDAIINIVHEARGKCKSAKISVMGILPRRSAVAETIHVNELLQSKCEFAGFDFISVAPMLTVTGPASTISTSGRMEFTWSIPAMNW